MEISSAIFSLDATGTLDLAKSIGLDTGLPDVNLGFLDSAVEKTVNLLPPSIQPANQGGGAGGGSPVPSKASGSNPNNPNDSIPNSDMTITGGYPEIAKGPLIGLAGLLDICSPASMNDIQGKNTLNGKVADPYCCDCGVGGEPVVGGGYILLKTLEKVRELQKSNLGNFIKQAKDGKISDGQALLGITGVLNNALNTNNGGVIPVAATIPIGQEGIKITMRDAVQRSDMDWIKAASDELGGGVIGPIIGENMGTLTGGLLTRGDTKGITTLNELLPDWSKDIAMGTMSNKASGYKTSALTDEQAKDVVIASSVQNKREIRA